MSEFIFQRWILKALSKDGNKNGLIQHVALKGALSSNLAVFSDALTALLSGDQEYEIYMSDLPQQIVQVCEERRSQAKNFTRNLLETNIIDKVEH